MKYGKAAVMVEENRVEIWEVPVVEPEPGGALVRGYRQLAEGAEFL